MENIDDKGLFAICIIVSDDLNVIFEKVWHFFSYFCLLVVSHFVLFIALSLIRLIYSLIIAISSPMSFTTEVHI